MIIETKKGNFLIEKCYSIFASRPGQHDVYVSKQTKNHGRKVDGVRWECIARFESETGNILKSYGAMPDEINIEKLKQWGFID